MAVYKGSTACRRCGTVRFIPENAPGFTHWFCHRRASDDAICWTYNTVDFSKLKKVEVDDAS